MILKKDLIEKLGEEYAPMINQISIPDFTKCIAYYSGLAIKDVSDKAIAEYLYKWATNKLHIFKMLGNKTRIDTNITYVDEVKNYEVEYNSLAAEYPAYALWLMSLGYPSKNKMCSIYDFAYDTRVACQRLFPHFTFEGTSITHFFKKCLKAPEDLINKIAAIYEHSTVTSIFTISIDPVDMMLASENPYGWTSCYRLEPENDASHADGCLAAVLDSASLITYAWNKKGDFSLGNDYSFKSIRYKRMREWIAVSHDFKAIHFNDIYPGKYAYPATFTKTWRDIIETHVANYLQVKNLWVKANADGTTLGNCLREFLYGYGEYNSDNVYVLKESVGKDYFIPVYNVSILCPCGCESIMPGSDDEWYEYQGGGFIHDNFSENYPEEEYCEYSDEPCGDAYNCCEENCHNCCWWKQAHEPDIEEIADEDESKNILNAMMNSANNYENKNLFDYGTFVTTEETENIL